MEDVRYNIIREYTLDPLGFSKKMKDSLNYDIMREIGTRNLFIFEKLKILLTELNKKDVSVIILKGSYLANCLYPFGIRPADDIDVLIKPGCFCKVDNILRQLGYYDDALNISIRIHHDISHKLTYFQKESSPSIPIDVHLSLGPYPYLGRIEQKLLWENTEIVKAYGLSLEVLNKEVQLLHLCLHLFQHLCESWIVSCCDIVLVLKYYGNLFDWNRFTKIVTTAKVHMPVELSLRKVNENFGNLIPLFIFEKLKQVKTSRAMRIVFHYSQKNQSDFDRFFIQFLTTPGFTFKLSCLKQLIYPGSKFLSYYCKGSYFKYLLSVFKSLSGLFKSNFHY